MPSRILFREMDPKHKAVLAALKKRFSVNTNSGAVCKLLDHYLDDIERLNMADQHRAHMVRLAMQEHEARLLAANEERTADRLRSDLHAYARGLTKNIRQIRIDL